MSQVYPTASASQSDNPSTYKLLLDNQIVQEAAQSLFNMWYKLANAYDESSLEPASKHELYTVKTHILHLSQGVEAIRESLFLEELNEIS